MRVSGWAPVVLGVLAAARAPSGRAEEPLKPPARGPEEPAPDPKVEAEKKRRLGLLKDRMAVWGAAKKGLMGTCTTCNGVGSNSALAGGRTVTTPCRRCAGRGKRVSKTNFKKLYYELMSPDWRRRPDAQREVEAVYLRMDGNLEPVPRLRSYRIEGMELLGDRHASVRVFHDDDSVAREVHWVWATDPLTKVSTWFLYGGDVDGRWGEVKDDEAAGDVGQEPGPCEPDVEQDVRARVERARLASTLEAVQCARSVLVLTLALPDPKTWEAAERIVHTDAVAALRAVLRDSPSCSALRLVFLAEWRDRFGAKSKLPWVVAGMPKETCRKIVFENLSPAEVFALFAVRWPQHGDLVVLLPHER